MLCDMKGPDNDNKTVLGMFSMDTREFRDRLNHLTSGAGIADLHVFRTVEQAQDLTRVTFADNITYV